MPPAESAPLPTPGLHLPASGSLSSGPRPALGGPCSPRVCLAWGSGTLPGSGCSSKSPLSPGVALFHDLFISMFVSLSLSVCLYLLPYLSVFVSVLPHLCLSHSLFLSLSVYVSLRQPPSRWDVLEEGAGRDEPTPGVKGQVRRWMSLERLLRLLPDHESFSFG